MNDLWQCYLIGLATGLAFTLPRLLAPKLDALLRRRHIERERAYWFRFWAKHQSTLRIERP